MRSRTKIWMGVIIALNITAGLLWAQGIDPSKGSPPPPDRALYPIPAPNVTVIGRILTEVGRTPIAGAYVRLEPVSPGPIVIYGEVAQPGPPPPNVRSDQAAGRAGQPQTPTPDKKPESATQGPVVGGPVYPTIYPGLGAVTDAEGNFKIAAYPGKFVVRIEAQGFEPEYYDNVKDKKDAKQIELQYGMPPVELAIRLKSISTLAGKVTEAGTGNAVTLGTVVAAAERIGLKRSASLGPDGTYLIEGLLEGRYTVQARARGYLPATYTSGTGSDNNIVTVRQNTAVTGIDFALSKGLAFSGKVTVEGGGLAGVIVVASRINAKEGLEQTAESGVDGSYTLSGLLAGDYIVYARKPGYAVQVYLNAKDRSQAKPVTVAADKQPTDIHFALSRVGTILGTVTAKADGKPVAGAVVTAYGVAGFGSRQAKTDAQGRYLIPDLPTADFLVTASAKGFVTLFYENTPDKAKAKQVRVLSDAHTTDINFAMAPLATISGTAIGPDGPIEGAQVMLSLRIQIKPPEPRPLPPEPGRPVPMPLPYPQPGYLMIVKTGANGAFKFENVEAGAYIVHASAKGFIGEYYDDVRSPDAAKPIEVAASQSVTGIDFRLIPLASTSGKVAAADGKPLKGIEGVAFVQRPMRDGIVPPPGGGPQPLPAGQAGGPTTTKEGAVASSGQGGTQPRQPGSQPPQPPTKDAPGSPPPSGQMGPQPQPTQRQAGGSADQKGGVVIQPGPVAPEGVPIPPDGYVTRFRAEVDAQTGTYKIVGLPEGNYVVRASADGYIPEFNGDAESAEKATPISVKDGDKITGVDFVLAKGGAISGFVLGDGDGRPVRGGQVTAQLLGDGGNASRVQPNGAFRVDGLRDGRYLLRAEGPGYVAEFYDDTRQPDKAKLIEIKAGAEVIDLIIGLARQSPIDFNGDGVVDFGDLFMFAQRFGQRKGMPQFNEAMDLNGDGGIDLEDFFAFVSQFTKDLKRAGKPVAGAEAGRASFTSASAPSGLVAVRMTLDATDLTGYAAALSYDREGLTFMRAERQDGGVPTVSSSPDGILLTDRASGPVTVTLTFRPTGDVRGGDLVTPKMIALIGADGALRLLDVAAAVQADATPKAFSLAQNAPNPFNPATQIAFETPADGPVNLTVYNLLGQRVRVLVDERRVAGRYVATWDGKDEIGRPAATGLYLYRLTAPGFTQTRKMLLLR